MQDNIIITKLTKKNSDNLMFRIESRSQFAWAVQICCIESGYFSKIGKSISSYIDRYYEEKYIKISYGEKNDSKLIWRLLPIDYQGYVTIEVDIELLNESCDSQKAKFYIKGELGQVESFGRRLEFFEEGSSICCALNPLDQSLSSDFA